VGKPPKGKLKYGGDAIDDGETEEEYRKRVEKAEFRQACKEIGIWLCCVAVICYFGWGFALKCIEEQNEKRRLGLI